MHCKGYMKYARVRLQEMKMKIPWRVAVAIGLVLLLVCPVPMHLYGKQVLTFPTQPQCSVIIGPTASTATGGWVSLGQPNCQDVHYWTMTWIALLDVGTIATCQVKLQQTGNKSSVSDLIANQTCTTSGTTSSATLQTSTSSYVRLSMGTKTGTGTVVVIANGYRQNPFGTPYGTLQQGSITSAMTGTTSTQVVAAVASNYLYITSCTVSNGHASVGTDMILQDGSGGTTIWNIPNPTSGSATGVNGATITWPTNSPLKVPTLGNALYVANVTTASSTKISCNGFSSPTSY